MPGTHPLQMIGRDKIIERVLDRLQRPDDVRQSNRPTDFILPGFYGVAGIGKSRLLNEIAARAASLTPYVVHIDFDPRAGQAVPGTPVELVRQMADTLEEQDRVACGFFQRALWGRNNPFNACRAAIADIKARPVVASQNITLSNSTASGLAQEIKVDETALGKADLPRLGQAFEQALLNLHCKGQTRQLFGAMGKPEPRPLVLVVLDTVELAPRPVREWMGQLPGFFGGMNRLKFHAVCVAAGRQAQMGWLETALPSLNAQESAAFVRVYVSYKKELDWTGRWTGLPLLLDGPLLDSVVAQGQGIPLLLQLLADVAALEPEAFARMAAAMPEAHEPRFRYVMEHYLRRLQEQADSQADEQAWQSYYLMLYGAVPRRLPGVGLLRALLADLPGTPFGGQTNYDSLAQRLGREAFIEHAPDGTLMFHDLVREGVLAHLRQSDPEQWARLHTRAAEWFEARGEPVERFYHAVQGDYAGTMGALKDSIATALEAHEWPRAQALIETTTPITLTAEDEAWLALYKADLAWGEYNPALALQRLRCLYAEDTPPSVQAQAEARLECWMGWTAELEQQARAGQELQVKAGEARDLLWWATQRNLKAVQAHALLELGEAAYEQARYAEAEEQYRRASELAEAMGDRRGQAAARLGLGQAAQMQDRHAEAEEQYRRALELYEAIGERRGQANVRHGLGDAALVQSRNAEAEEQYRRALELYEAIGERRGQANVRQRLSEAALAQSRYAEAEVHLRRMLELAEAIGDRLGQAYAWRGLSEAALAQSRYAEAEMHLRRALELFEAIGDRLGQAYARLGLGQAALTQSRYAEAEVHLRRALELYEAIGERRGQAHAWHELGQAALTQSRHAEAEEQYRHALELYEAMGDRPGQTNVRLGLGDAALAQSRNAEAEEQYRRALELAEAIGGRRGQANARHGLGEAALAQSRYAEAEVHLRRALELFEAIGDRRGQANARLGLGQAALEQDRYGDAQAWLDAACALYAAIGLSQEMMRRSIIVGREALDQYEAHRAQGNAVLAGQALALAHHLCQMAEGVAGQLPPSDESGELARDLTGLRVRLMELNSHPAQVPPVKTRRVRRPSPQAGSDNSAQEA